MRIRDAVESDLPRILEIYNATIPTRLVTAELEPVTVEDRLAWFRAHSSDHHPCWAVDIDGQLAGWISFHSFITRCAYAGTAEISVYVHEDFRKRGLGRYLLGEAISRGPDLGLSALIGCIFGHNTPSLRLFEQAGFERWGHLPGVARLDDVIRDLVIVGKHLRERNPPTRHGLAEVLHP